MPTRIKIFVYGVIAIVAATVIVGFITVGSPQNKRLQNFDAQRVQDLQNLQGQIIYYWQAKNKLPAQLSDLNDPTRGTIVPTDPQTGAEYEYVPKAGVAEFTLCANFSLPSNASVPRAAAPVGPYGNGTTNWDHSAGRTCFDRTIDKDFYKPINPAPVPIK